MRHRLYYLVPDIESARRTRDDILLSCIERRHIHFFSRSPLPDDLPQANFLHTTDIIHGAESGMLVGALLGFAVGVVIVLYFDFNAASTQAAAVVAAALIGLLFGGWAASLVAASLPNSRLKCFDGDLDGGRLLLIVDVPNQRVAEIEKLLRERHPEDGFKGEEPHIPAFP
ncbi:DUF1269 domain-containing protein [Oxalobacteraceae bacterium OM1]|nr:DUF1269 domain-containing protein [Oxalobacteraceae bacterium OM1]